MSRKLLLVAVGGGIVIALLVAALLGAAVQRQRMQATSTEAVPAQMDVPPPVQPPAPLPAASTPDGADTTLAINSTDPTFVQFLSSFKTSADASCKASLIGATKNASDDFADKAAAICACASNDVVPTITVGEARLAIGSAVVGDTSTNPTLQALKTRFIAAGKACMAKTKDN